MMNDASKQQDPLTAPQAQETKDSTQKRRARYSPIFVISHWLLVITIPLLFVTGYSLHEVVRASMSGPGNRLSDWALAGRMHLYHIYLAYLFAPALLAAIISALIHPQARKVFRRRSIVVLLFGSLVLLITGYLMFHIVGSRPLYTFARSLHSLLGLYLVPIAYLYHLVEALVTKRRKLLVKSFVPPKQANWIAGIVGLVILVILTTSMLLNTAYMVCPIRILQAMPVESSHDAASTDYASLPWEETPELEIALANGMGFNQGCTQVKLKALYDEDNIYISAVWADPREDRQYTPWKKTEGGWKRMVTDPMDESVYYEDKFSLVFPIEDDGSFERFGCAEYCHLGGGNAYGYKASDIPVDVWHWKATRTAPVGQVDDKYWTEPDLESPTKGRHGDPKTGGGYEKNEIKEADHPAFLPEELRFMHDGMIPREHAVPYDASIAETYANGKVIAGIVASAFEGDRGDVLCQSSYHDGRWHVYICRKLDTGSPHDRAFKPGDKIPFGCAAFDCSSKRHAYELATYWLKLEK